MPQGGREQQQWTPHSGREARARFETKWSLGYGCKVGGGGGLQEGESALDGAEGALRGLAVRGRVQRGRGRPSKPSTGLSAWGTLTVLTEERTRKRAAGWGYGQSHDGACGSLRWSEPRGRAGQRG